MRFNRRTVGWLLLGTGACVLAGPAIARVFAHPSAGPGSPGRVEGQEAPPNRREFTVVAKDYAFSPNRLEVLQDDLVKLTVRSEDVAYSVTIDEYRVAKRVPAGGSTTFEFRTDRPGTFPFYSNLTSDARHSQARGQLIVRPR
ncbi:MAG TPA: cupredoxin domain-containing protein [Vicinamibacterales bacterium]